ncbi:MAG: hypothetical protein MJ239_05170 [Bacilli bacterium]|nr:hypothetical protein [Bacilli bacterium]
MKKILPIVSSCAAVALCGAAMMSPKANTAEVKATASQRKIHYYNSLDYLGTTNKIGDYNIAGGCAMFSGAAGYTSNLIDDIEETLTTDWVASVDHGWGFAPDWSKTNWVIGFDNGQQLVVNFQRNGGENGPFYCWINNFGDGNADSWEQGGYWVGPVDNYLGSWHNFKIALHGGNRITAYVDNMACFDTDYAHAGITGGNVTTLKFGGDAINSAGSYIDNILVEDYAVGGGYEAAFDFVPAGWTDRGDGSYIAESYNNQYIRHLGRNHSIRYEAEIVFGTNFMFDMMSYDIVDSPVAEGCDHSIAVRLGYDGINERYYASTVYATTAGWQSQYYAMEGQLQAYTYNKIAVTYLSSGMNVAINDNVVWSATWNELGLHKAINTGTIHYVNFDGSTVAMKNCKQIELYEGADSALLDSTVKNEVSTFMTDYMTNRAVKGGVYSICDAIADNTTAQAIVNKYDALSAEAKAVVSAAYDGNGITVGDTITYIRNRLAGNSSAMFLGAFDNNDGAIWAIGSIGLIAIGLSAALLYKRSKKAN